MRSKKRNGPRFQIGDRVGWRTNTQTKFGTVVALGKTREEALAQLGNQYHVVYRSQKERSSGDIFYYVAADTPLFRPGYHAHSVPERHLSPETECWEFKELAIQKLSTTTLKRMVHHLAEIAHTKKSKTPKVLQDLFQEHCPEVLGKKQNPPPDQS